MPYKANNKSKFMSIVGLFIMAMLILISGIGFSIYSLINNIEFTVFKTQVPGAVFGLVVAFLGVRYLASVMHLKSELDSSDSGFSWSNFRKTDKSAKSASARK
jgi:hypothetical protein